MKSARRSRALTLPVFARIVTSKFAQLLKSTPEHPIIALMSLGIGGCLKLSGWISLLLLFCSGCGPPPRNELVVGMELKYPPFEMVDAAGKPAGVSVEMALALGKFLGREVRIENIPFDGLLPALKTKKIDLIISSLTETPERAKSIDFSDPYLRTGLCLLINKSAAFDSIADADKPNVTFAVRQGTTGQIYARNYLKHARILVLDGEDACVLEVLQNKAQAFIYDQMSVYKNWSQHRDVTRAALQPFQEERWAIGLRKHDQLKSKVNDFLKDFRARGGFEKLGETYLKEQKESFRNLNIPFVFLIENRK